MEKALAKLSAGSFGFPTTADEALMDLIDTMLLLFSIVSSPSFQNFVSTVQKDPKWRPPHRAKVSNVLQPQAHGKVMQTISSFVNDCTYVSMTTDGWTGPKGQSYWSLTIHGITKAFDFTSIVAVCIPIYSKHNALNISTQLKPVLEQLGALDGKLCAIVSDEGGAAPYIVDHFDGVQSIHCAAHLLQTVQRTAFSDLEKAYPVVAVVQDIASSIISSYRNSSFTRNELLHLQLEKGESTSQLVAAAPTRFNSCLNSFRSLIRSEESIIDWMSRSTTNKSANIRYALANCTYFWTIIKEVASILENFESTSKLFQQDKVPTLHLIISEIVILRQTLKALEGGMSEPCRYLIDRLLFHIERKFEPWSEMELLAFSLDPSARCSTDPDMVAILKQADQVLHQYLPHVPLLQRSLQTKGIINLIQLNQG
jgi:hypothetical protein